MSATMSKRQIRKGRETRTYKNDAAEAKAEVNHWCSVFPEYRDLMSDVRWFLRVMGDSRDDGPHRFKHPHA